MFEEKNQSTYDNKVFQTEIKDDLLGHKSTASD